MDIRKIKKLIELVEESGITELEVQEEEGTVRISRAAPAVAPAAVQLRHPHQLHLMNYQAILYVLQWWERSIAVQAQKQKHSLKWVSL